MVHASNGNGQPVKNVRLKAAGPEPVKLFADNDLRLLWLAAHGVEVDI
jgi:hypothetical protein